MRIDVTTTTTNTNSEDRDYKNLSQDYDDAIHANFFYFAKKVCLIFLSKSNWWWYKDGMSGE